MLYAITTHTALPAIRTLFVGIDFNDSLSLLTDSTLRAIIWIGAGYTREANRIYGSWIFTDTTGMPNR